MIPSLLLCPTFVVKLSTLAKMVRPSITQNIEAMCMSTLTGEGVTEVKSRACDKLLAMRVEAKMRTGKVNDVLNRVTVGEPTPRDDKIRAPCIPEAVLARRRGQGAMDSSAEKQKKKSLQDRYMEEGPEFSWDHRGACRDFFSLLYALCCSVRSHGCGSGMNECCLPGRSGVSGSAGCVLVPKARFGWVVTRVSHDEGICRRVWLMAMWGWQSVRFSINPWARTDL